MDRRGAQRVAEGTALAAGVGGACGGVWVAAAGRPFFHRHVIASGVSLGAVAGSYLGVRQMLIAAQMHDAAPVSVLAGFYTSAALSVAAGIRRSRILPWAMFTGAAAGLAHLAYDRVELSKHAYVRSLPAGRPPTIVDWLAWAAAPPKRSEWTHRIGAQLDWLLFGNDIIEVRRRLAERRSGGTRRQEAGSSPAEE